MASCSRVPFQAFTMDMQCPPAPFQAAAMAYKAAPRTFQLVMASATRNTHILCSLSTPPLPHERLAHTTKINEVLPPAAPKRSPMEEYMAELGVEYITFGTVHDPSEKIFTAMGQRMNEQEYVDFCRARGQAARELFQAMREACKGYESEILANFEDLRRRRNPCSGDVVAANRIYEEDVKIPNFDELSQFKLPRSPQSSEN